MATVRQSGGDYGSLNAALAAAETTIDIDQAWTADDTTKATIATDNTTITVSGGAKHPGYWDESQNHYRLVGSSGHALTLNGAYTATIDGMAVEQAGTGQSDEAFRCVPGTSDTVTIKNTILRCANNTRQQDGIYTGFNTSIGTVTLENCVIYGAARAGIHPQNCVDFSATGTINVNSCVIWLNGRYGSSSSSGDVGGGISVQVGSSRDGSGFLVNIYNTVAVENDTGNSGGGVSPADYNFFDAGVSATWDIHNSIDSDNSIASRDASAVGTLASRTATDNTSPGAGNWVIFEDISTAPYDLRLVSNAENDAQDAHSNGSGAGLTIPTTDIVGTSRPQNTDYDIGAFEISAGGGGTTHDGTVTDGLAFGESLTTVASLSSSFSDTVTFGEAVNRTAVLLASLSDGLSLGDSNARNKTLSASLADGLSLGESSGRNANYVASLSDGMTLGDSATVAVTLNGTVIDGLTLGDALSVAAVLSALAADGIVWSDVADGTLESALAGVVTDGIAFGSSTSATALLYASAADGMTFGDTITAILTALATVSDGISFGDTAAGSILANVIVAALSDGLVFGDSGQVSASFTATVSDGIAFGETVQAIATLLASLSDTIQIGDVTAEISTIANGLVTVTFTLKQAGISFTVRQPGTTFTM